MAEGKTVPELTALSLPIVGTDKLVIYRSPGPLNSVAASAINTYLDLGTMATQDADAVAITGGTITGTTAISLAGGTVTASAPMIQATQTWNEPDTVFTATKLNVTSTASAFTSRFIDYQVAGNSIYRILKSGETLISNAAGTSYGGIALVGNAGEMALTSQVGASSTFASQVFRWYWEDAGQTASVLRGFGTNRTSFESNSAITFIADSSRFEFEGDFSATTLQVTPYQKASANGVPFHFTNNGQTPTPAKVMMITNAFSAITNILELYDRSSGSEVIRFGFETAGTLTQTIGANVAAHVITGYSLTGSNASAGISMTGTWNTSGDANALDISITNTASGTNANLIRARVGGTSVFSVSKVGNIAAAGECRVTGRYYGVGTSAYAQFDDAVGARIAYGNAVLNVGGPLVFTNSGTERFRVSNSTGDLTASGSLQMHSATAIPAGGVAGSGLKMFSTSNFGVFGGSGAPTLSAAKGSLYLRSDGSGTNDRAYINTNGSTTWTAIVTVA